MCPNVLKKITVKLNNYQLYLPNFLKLYDKISHNLLRPNQFLEKFCKFWNGPLCRNKSVPSTYSILQHNSRESTPNLVSRNCLRYLPATLIMGSGRFVSEFMWGISDSRPWKKCPKIMCFEFEFLVNTKKYLK